MKAGVSFPTQPAIKNAVNAKAIKECVAVILLLYFFIAEKGSVKKLEKIDGLLFGFPCNDFSLVGKNKKLKGEYGGLYKRACDALEYLKPNFFVAENVTSLGKKLNYNTEIPLPAKDIFKKEKIDIYVKDDIYITVPKRKKKIISAFIEYNGPIPAPVEKDVKLGVLNIFLNEELFAQHNVFSMEKIKKVNIFKRIIKSFNFFVWGDA